MKPGLSIESALCLALLLLGLFLVLPGAALAGDDLADLLPRSGEVKGWSLGPEIGRARGEELFELINGGAEIYLRQGFVEALLATYEGGKGREVNLEIYRMEDPTSARAVHERKSAGLTRAAPLGDGALFGDYFVFVLKGAFQISLTASFQDQTTDSVLKDLAQALLKKLP